MLRPTIPLLLALAATVAGCVNAPAETLEPAAVDTPIDAGGLPSTEEVPGDIQVSAATPVRTVNNGGTFSTVIELKENTTGFVLELEWTPTTPASESLSMWVRGAGTGSVTVPPDPALVTNTDPPLAQVDGPGPLRLALAADAFPEPGEYDVVIRASAEPVGFAANQPFTIHLTTFEGIAFDEAYSALGATDDA